MRAMKRMENLFFFKKLIIVIFNISSFFSGNFSSQTGVKGIVKVKNDDVI